MYLLKIKIIDKMLFAVFTINCFYAFNFSLPIVQQGQHPLTGQRAANFRLLANQ